MAERKERQALIDKRVVLRRTFCCVCVAVCVSWCALCGQQVEPQGADREIRPRKLNRLSSTQAEHVTQDRLRSAVLVSSQPSTMRPRDLIVALCEEASVSWHVTGEVKVSTHPITVPIGEMKGSDILNTLSQIGIEMKVTEAGASWSVRRPESSSSQRGAATQASAASGDARSTTAGGAFFK